MRAEVGEVVLADIDADGDLDAFLGSWLLWNDGVGGFTGQRWIASPPRDLRVGDLDGDGDLDALSGATTGLTCYLNAGLGNFFASRCSGTADAFPPIALGDLDGDGDLDALLARQQLCFGFSGFSLALHRNDGTGNLVRDLAAFPIDLVSRSSAPLLGDVDGDGDIDAVVPRWDCATNTTSFWTYLNSGSGSFTTGRALSSPSSSVPSPLLADLDRDRDPDLVLVGSGVASLFWNDGRGSFAFDALALPANLTAPQGAAHSADLDRDGDVDLVLGSTEVLWNNGQRRFVLGAAAIPSVRSGVDSFALGDVDGDGDIDALLVRLPASSTSEARSELYLNDGAGNFFGVDPENLGAADTSTDGVLVDIDLDGDADLIVANLSPTSPNGTPERCRLHLNDGTGRFSEIPNLLLTTPDRVQTLVAGDLDGDGDSDLVLGTASGVVALYRNLLRGPIPLRMPALVELQGSFPTINAPVNDLALADIDADGDLDLYVATGGSNALAQDRLFRNDGNAGFTDISAQLPPSVEDTRGVAFGDVDGDGDLDCATTHLTNAQGGLGTIELALNDGAGLFTDATSGVNGPVVPTFEVHLVDIDRDGDLDLVTGGTGRIANVMLGDGRGGFVELPAATPVGSSARLTPLDADGDGDLDFAVSTHFWLLLNRGDGNFESTRTAFRALVDELGVASAASDLDGDGDHDLVALRGGPLERPQANVVLLNLHHQLGYRAGPRLGKRQTLELSGQRNGSALLFAAASRTSIPLPPLGTLSLDPASMLLVGSARLDASGRASISALVPFDPSLLGRSVYWQMLSGPTARLSNLEFTTFRAL
ncbi:MAG: VCBS repeat-containing protein [Planctomycetes bacterium]|nr:VCBS repeat-containing protein [Planctomycetota bacterium]